MKFAKYMFMSKKFCYGTIFFVISSLVCKIIGAFFRIPLSEILGAEGMGLYQLIMPFFSFALILSSGGMATSIARSISVKRAQGKGVNGLFSFSFWYLLALGTLFALTFGIFGKQIASLQGNADAGILYFAIAIGLLFACLLAGFRGYFQGHENMYPTAISQLIEQTTKLVLGLLLAVLLLPYGFRFGALGAVLGVTISEILGFIYLFIIFFRKKGKFSRFVKSEAKELLKTSVPLTIASLAIPLTAVFDSMLVINLLKKFSSEAAATALYGVASGMINSIINLPVVIAIALGTSILPALSYATEKKENIVADKISRKAFLISYLILVPASIGLIVLAPTILSVLFPTSLSGELLSVAVELLAIGGISVLFMGLVQITTSLMQAIGKIKTSVLGLYIGAVIKVILTIVLVSNPQIGILGMMYSSLAMYAFICFYNLIFLVGKLDFLGSFTKMILPLFASCVMGLSIGAIQNSLNVHSILLLGVCLSAGGVVYFIFTIPILKGLRR